LSENAFSSTVAVDPSDVPSVGTFDLDSSQYRLINDRLMNGNVYTIEKVNLN